MLWNGLATMSGHVGRQIRNRYARPSPEAGQADCYAVALLSVSPGLMSSNPLEDIEIIHRMDRVYAAYNAQRPTGCSHLWEMSR